MRWIGVAVLLFSSKCISQLPTNQLLSPTPYRLLSLHAARIALLRLV
jgi:hypothetical protein